MRTPKLIRHLCPTYQLGPALILCRHSAQHQRNGIPEINCLDRQTAKSTHHTMNIANHAASAKFGVVPLLLFFLSASPKVSYKRVFTLICWREHWFLKRFLAISSSGLSASIARAPFCETPILGSNSSHTTPPQIPLVKKRSFVGMVRGGRSPITIVT